MLCQFENDSVLEVIPQTVYINRHAGALQFSTTYQLLPTVIPCNSLLLLPNQVINY